MTYPKFTLLLDRYLDAKKKYDEYQTSGQPAYDATFIRECESDLMDARGNLDRYMEKLK